MDNGLSVSTRLVKAVVLKKGPFSAHGLFFWAQMTSIVDKLNVFFMIFKIWNAHDI